MPFLDDTGVEELTTNIKTKVYADFVPKTGGTFTGDVTIDEGLTLNILSSNGNTVAITAPGAWVGDRAVSLPTVSGTLAVTSQIPTVPTLQDVTSEALSAANTSLATIDGLKLYAYGSFRILAGYITAVNLSTSQATVANVAVGHRPAVQTAIAWAWDAARYNTYVVAGTSGTIAVRSNAAYTSGNLRMNAIWVVA